MDRVMEYRSIAMAEDMGETAVMSPDKIDVDEVDATDEINRREDEIASMEASPATLYTFVLDWLVERMNAAGSSPAVKFGYTTRPYKTRLEEWRRDYHKVAESRGVSDLGLHDLHETADSWVYVRLSEITGDDADGDVTIRAYYDDHLLHSWLKAHGWEMVRDWARENGHADAIKPVEANDLSVEFYLDPTTGRSSAEDLKGLAADVLRRFRSDAREDFIEHAKTSGVDFSHDDGWKIASGLTRVDGDRPCMYLCSPSRSASTHVMEWRTPDDSNVRPPFTMRGYQSRVVDELVAKMTADMELSDHAGHALEQTDGAGHGHGHAQVSTTRADRRHAHDLLLSAPTRSGKTFMILKAADAILDKIDEARHAGGDEAPHSSECEGRQEWPDRHVVVVMTGKADVLNEWREGVELNGGFNRWVDEARTRTRWRAIDPHTFADLASRGVDPIEDGFSHADRLLVIVTVQDMAGSLDEAKAKHEALFDPKHKNEIDLVLGDEAHYGLFGTERYSKAVGYDGSASASEADPHDEDSVLGASNDEIRSVLDDGSDGEDRLADDEIESAKNVNSISPKIGRIYCSATPFNILWNGVIPDQNVVTVSQGEIAAEKNKDREVGGDVWRNSPYYGMPEALYAGLDLRHVLPASKDMTVQGALKDLFEVEKDKAGWKFKRGREVRRLFSGLFGLIDPDHDKKPEEAAAWKNAVPALFSKDLVDGEGRLGRHLVLKFNRRIQCEAMARVLTSLFPVDKGTGHAEYTPIVISGAVDGKTADDGGGDGIDDRSGVIHVAGDSVAEIKRIIREYDDRGLKTVSLTVNRMATGVTVPQWDVAIVCSPMGSMEAKVQFYGRVNSPHVVYQPSGRVSQDHAEDLDDSPAGPDGLVKTCVKPVTLAIDLDADEMASMIIQTTRMTRISKRMADSGDPVDVDDESEYPSGDVFIQDSDTHLLSSRTYEDLNQVLLRQLSDVSRLEQLTTVRADSQIKRIIKSDGLRGEGLMAMIDRSPLDLDGRSVTKAVEISPLVDDDGARQPRCVNMVGSGSNWKRCPNPASEDPRKQGYCLACWETVRAPAAKHARDLLSLVDAEHVTMKQAMGALNEDERAVLKKRDEQDDSRCRYVNARLTANVTMLSVWRLLYYLSAYSNMSTGGDAPCGGLSFLDSISMCIDRMIDNESRLDDAGYAVIDHRRLGLDPHWLRLVYNKGLFSAYEQSGNFAKVETVIRAKLNEMERLVIKENDGDKAFAPVGRLLGFFDLVQTIARLNKAEVATPVKVVEMMLDGLLADCPQLIDEADRLVMTAESGHDRLMIDPGCKTGVYPVMAAYRLVREIMRRHVDENGESVVDAGRALRTIGEGLTSVCTSARTFEIVRAVYKSLGWPLSNVKFYGNEEDAPGAWVSALRKHVDKIVRQGKLTDTKAETIIAGYLDKSKKDVKGSTNPFEVGRKNKMMENDADKRDQYRKKALRMALSGLEGYHTIMDVSTWDGLVAVVDKWAETHEAEADSAFSVALGNPPYQMQASETNQTTVVDLFPSFTLLSVDLADLTSMLEPIGRWWQNSKKELHKELLSSRRIVSLNYWPAESIGRLFSGQTVSVNDGIGVLVIGQERHDVIRMSMEGSPRETVEYASLLSKPCTPLTAIDNKILTSIASAGLPRWRDSHNVRRGDLHGLTGSRLAKHVLEEVPSDSIPPEGTVKIYSTTSSNIGGAKSKYWLVDEGVIAGNMTKGFKVCFGESMIEDLCNTYRTYVLDDKTTFGRSTVMLGAVDSRLRADNMLSYVSTAFAEYCMRSSLPARMSAVAANLPDVSSTLNPRTGKIGWDSDWTDDDLKIVFKDVLTEDDWKHIEDTVAR